MQLPITARNPLTFPHGASPGFNPNHSAMAGATALRFSAVAVSTGGGFYCIFPTPGKTPTKTGTVNSTYDGILGPCTKTASGTNRLNFAGQSTISDATATLAVMVRPTSFASEAHWWNTSSATTSGWDLGTESSSGIVKVLNGGFNSATDTGVTLVANNAYFVAVSLKASTTLNCVAVNLNTGQIFSSTGSTTLTAVAPNGTMCVCADTASGLAGNLAAVMATNGFMTVSELLNWAQDPWSFWYPTNDDDLLAVIVGKVATSIKPFQSNLFFM